MSDTRKRNNPGGTAFGAWIREQPEIDSLRYHLDCEDFDVAWFDYWQGKLMLLEMKEFQATPTLAQRDTFGVIDQALHKAFSDPLFRVARKLPARPTKIAYYGWHVVQFERTSPDNGKIWIDGISVSRETFLRFLRFEWSPPDIREIDIENIDIDTGEYAALADATF